MFGREALNLLSLILSLPFDSCHWNIFLLRNIAVLFHVSFVRPAQEKLLSFTDGKCIKFLFHSYRQAQATVLEALPKLKKHNIPTKRPEDYFAEMTKTDQHMQKVCPHVTLTVSISKHNK